MIPKLIAISVAASCLSLGNAAASDPVADYNAGVDLYRDAEFDQAAEKFRAAASADRTSLAAKARYNLGNTHYARAVGMLRNQPPADPGGVIDQLCSAILQYLSALRLDPEDEDARANIELAGRLIDRLEEQQEQNSEQPDHQEPKQEEGERKEEGQKDGEQQDGEQQDGEQQDGEQQDGEQQDGEQQDGEQQNGEQQDGGQQDGEQQKESQQQSDDAQQSDRSAGKPGEQSQENRTNEQSDANEQSDPNQQGGEQEKTPQGEVKAANEPAESTPDNAANPTSVQVENSDQMSEQEAEKLLQWIRDRDMLRRTQREAARRARRAPVPRDW